MTNEELVKALSELKAPQHAQYVQPPRKRREFSKIALFTLLIASIIWITMDYILAYVNAMPINAEVTISIIQVNLGGMIAYFGKSYLEKRNRNYHKLDNCGNPLCDTTAKEQRKDEEAVG